jgi:hypothetical protein
VTRAVAPQRRRGHAAVRAPSWRTAAALFVAVAAVDAGCSGKRERLDVPRLSLQVPEQAPAPGGTVSGTVAAADASGLTLLAVYACTADSVFRDHADLSRERSADFQFSLHVADDAVPGSEVEVYAVAGDDQGFYTDTARALTVGDAPPPVVGASAVVAAATTGRAAAAEPLCPRVSRVRRAPLPTSDAPTGPRP